MSKLNAKDYLLEYKAKGNTPNWLGLLIQNAVDSNGQIFEADKKNIFAKLLEENKLDIISTNELTANISDNLIDLTDKQSTNNQQKLVLKKITHIKGVNALIPNQSINFSPSCTVVYGLNGTGKSGYFRIIHELTGGKKQKSVLCNIRSQNDELEVDIDFSLDGNQQNQYKWQDRYKRGVLPFNQMAVFDSEYLPILLNERESSANIVPLGLHLFQVITSVIDDFKQQLEEKQSEYETSLLLT